MGIKQRISLFYNKRVRLIRFFLILVFALWINFYLIVDLKINSDEFNRMKIDNTTYVDLRGFDLTQEDLRSGNLNIIFWKSIYLGGLRDRICFEKENPLDNKGFYASYNNGEFYEVLNKECFSIDNDEEYITFDLKYNFEIILPELEEPLSPVNKSECIPDTINEEAHTCLTKEGIKNAKALEVFFPETNVYFEANWFHKLIKFIFIFFSTGAVLWAFSRTFFLIKYGWEKK